MHSPIQTYTKLNARGQCFGRTIGGRLGSLEVNESTSSRLALLVIDDLARGDVAEHAEGVVELLVVDGLLQALDKDVADTRATDQKKKRGQMWTP